jgi:hypothetical protein
MRLPLNLPAELEQRLRERVNGTDELAFVVRAIEEKLQRPAAEGLLIERPEILDVSDCSRQFPRGLIPIPPEVAETVARQAAGDPALTAEQVRQLTERRTLEYHYKGVTVAYRRTDAGLEVLAVGVVETAQLLNRLSPEAQTGILWEQI